MFKTILFTISLMFTAFTQQQIAESTPTQTAQFDECGWFLCKPPVQVAQLD